MTRLPTDARPVSLSFGQVEAVLAQLHRVADDKRVAFQARLKHFQRLGFPDGTNTGKGKAVSYSFQQFMMLVVGFELLQAGLTPLTVSRIVTNNWTAIRGAVYMVVFDERKPRLFENEDSSFFWVLTPEALRDFSEEGFGPWDQMEAIDLISAGNLSAYLSSDVRVGVLGESWRHLVLWGTRISRIAVSALVDRGFASIQGMQSELEDEDRQFADMSRVLSDFIAKRGLSDADDPQA